MENASKALIMAASVLLGLMIISVGVVLFKSFGGFSREITNEIQKKQIAEFNTQFLKYEGKSFNNETKQNEIIKITTHDIVTLANLAQKNNIEYELTNQTQSKKKNENTYYVQIDLEEGTKKSTNLERWTEKELTDFMQENNMNQDNKIKYYYINNIEISNITGRVTYVEIKKL